MKQVVKYQACIVPDKLRVEIRITIDDRGVEYVSEYNGDRTTNITLLPILSLSIIRKAETDENGNRIRSPFNKNDMLSMTKFNLSTLLNNLKKIRNDLNTPDLYTYQNKCLEINEALAENIRNPFMVGNMAVELSSVVVKIGDDTRVEGIKMKFNNESSSVLLTINELESLIHNIENINIDSIALLLYFNYVKNNNSMKQTNSYTDDTLKPIVDIIPKGNIV